MAKYICNVCGTIHEGLEPPNECPLCKASSSHFSLIAQKVEKLQKINDEDYEIIKKLESEGYNKTVEWYQENYDSELLEAKEIVKTIKEKYNVNSNDDNEILSMFNSKREITQVAKWYSETYSVSFQDAWVKVDEVLKKHNVEKMGVTSGSGCMITILITITSTLSLLLML